MKYKILLFLIFLLGFILRFWQLGANPASLDWDEASLGYNAYSILKTGKDEYGNFMPSSIRSFGDYKPPLYTYLTIVPVYLFGLNEFSTRFISALFGILTVLVAYFLIKKLFPLKPSIFYLLFSIFFSLSPWHIQFSRIAFEANLALFWFISGILFFINGLTKGKYFILSSISFALASYSYHSPRLLIPILILGMVFIYRKDILKNLRYAVYALVILVLLIFPILKDLTSATSSRFGSVTVLNPLERLGASIETIKEDEKKGDVFGKFVHNRRIIYGREVLGGYLDHFNFNFLFLYGDAPGRHHAIDMGMLYLWDFPFILIGIIYLLRNLSKSTKLSFVWFAIAPLASSLTTGTPHAVRALFYLPLYQLFIAFGVFSFISFMKSARKIVKVGIICFTFIVFILNFFYYLHMYWEHTPIEYAASWQYGYKEAVKKVAEVESNFDKVIVTYQYDQPYIYFLYYNQIDPSWYQNNWGVGEIKRAERSFGKYEFRSINWEKDKNLKNVLFVGTPSEIPKETSNTISEIKFPDGSSAFQIVGRK